MFLFEWIEDVKGAELNQNIWRGKNILASKVVYQKKHFSSFLLLVFIKVYEGQYKTVINGIWTFDVYNVISGGLDKF